MIGYPFDSHVEYDEHDMPVFDRAISSAPLKNLIAKLFSNGVLPNPSTNLQVVTGGEGMSVIVKAGFCIINGGLKLEDEDKTLVVQASDSTYPRIDTVVMRWNDNDEVRTCDLYVVEGTPNATPTRPALTRSGSIYEIGLADIFITANSTSIDSFRITDTRMDNTRCGYISSISEFDTTTLYNQIQADLANFQENEQADFLAWFEEMRDQLSEDAAGNLQLQMDTLNGRYNGLTQDISEFVVLNQLPSQGREKTLYLITGEEETHYAGDVQDDTSIINDNVIAKGTTFSSDRIDTLLGYKVNAEQGKGLSTNDFTNADKTKVDSAITVVKTINGQDIRGTGNINIPVGTQVEPNPVLSGTEPELDGIGINGAKYKVIGGVSDPDAKGAVGDGVTDDSNAFTEGDYIYQLTEGKTYKVTATKIRAISDNGVEGRGRIRYIADNYYDTHIYGNNTRLLPTYGKQIHEKSARKPINRLEECVGWLTKARTFNTESLGRYFKSQGIKRPDDEAGNYLPIGAIYHDYDKANDLPDQFTICFGRMYTFQRKNGETEWTMTNNSVPATSGIKNYALPWVPEYTRNFNHTPTIVGDHVELIVDKEELTSWQGSQSGKTEGIVHFWGKAHVFEANEYDDVIVCQELWVKEAEAANLLQFVVALDIRSNTGAEVAYMAQSIFQPQMPIPSTPERFWTCTMNIDDARTVDYEGLISQMSATQYGEWTKDGGRNLNLIGFEDLEVTSGAYTATFDEDTGIFEMSHEEGGSTSWISISLTSYLKSIPPIRKGDKFRLNFHFTEHPSSTYIGSIYYASGVSMATGSGLESKGNETYTKLFTAEADFASFALGLSGNLNYKLQIWITKGEEYKPYQKYGEQIKGYVLNDNVIDKVLQDRINALDVKVPDVYPTDGTYTLKATVADGTITYSWVADT